LTRSRATIRNRRDANGARQLLDGAIARTVLSIVLLLGCFGRFRGGVPWINPPYSAFMAEAQIAAGQPDSSYVFRYSWVDLSRISPNLPLAVVARKIRISGTLGLRRRIDRKGLCPNQHSRSRAGRQTISQQVAKICSYGPAQLFPERTRGLFHVLIEGCWPKRRILEIYLNIAEFGTAPMARSRRATLLPTQKPPLERGDAAVLAAVLPNPGAPFRGAPSRYVQQPARLDSRADAGAPAVEMLDEIDAYPR